MRGMLAGLAAVLLLAGCGESVYPPDQARSLTYQSSGSWQSQMVIWAADTRHVELFVFQRQSRCRVAYRGLYLEWTGVHYVQGASDYIVPCRRSDTPFPQM